MTLFNDGYEVTLGILNIFHQSKFDKTPGFVTFPFIITLKMAA